MLKTERSSRKTGSPAKTRVTRGHAPAVASGVLAVLGFVVGCNALSGVDDFSVVDASGTDASGVDAPDNQDVSDAPESQDVSDAPDSQDVNDGGSVVDRNTSDILSPPEAATSTALRIRCGVLAGPNYVDSVGQTWVNDEDYSPADTKTYANDVAVTKTADPTLYHSERYADRTAFPSGFTYSFDVPPGPYVVKLHFAETLQPNANHVGYREFNVIINGTPVLTNFDIVATAGWGAACVETFPTSVAVGVPLTVQFTPGAAQDPKVDDIEIVSGSSDSD